MDRRRFLLAGTQALAAGSIWALFGRSGGPGGWAIPGLDEARAAGGTEGARGGSAGAPGALPKPAPAPQSTPLLVVSTAPRPPPSPAPRSMPSAGWGGSFPAGRASS